MSSTAIVSVSPSIVTPLSSVTATTAIPSVQTSHIAPQQSLVFGNNPTLFASQQPGDFGNLALKPPVSFTKLKPLTANSTSNNAKPNDSVVQTASQQSTNSMNLQAPQSFSPENLPTQPNTAIMQQSIPLMQQSTPVIASSMTMLGLYRTIPNTNYKGASSANQIGQIGLPTQAMQELSINEDAEMTNQDVEERAHQAYDHFRTQCRPYLIGMERIGVRTQD